MRFCWADAGDDPDYAAGDRHGIDGYFWPLFDSLTTTVNLLDTQARGHVAGIYMATNWPQFAGKTPTQTAAAVSAEYLRLAVPGLRVQFDIEEHDPDKIASTLEAWRSLRRGVGTSWTMEGGQGGWMTPEFVQRILACKVRIVPQLYNGAMTEVWDSLAYARDLTSRGFPDAIISPFYDAAELPVGWDGYCFTAGRLP